jgi:predicted RNA-binding Zn-ribbon protein involved in translation (DUF1610 family)
MVKSPNGKLHLDEVATPWTPDCPSCKKKMRLIFRRCYGCGLFFAREFRCEGEMAPTIHSIAFTCPNCGYVH